MSIMTGKYGLNELKPEQEAGGSPQPAPRSSAFDNVRAELYNSGKSLIPKNPGKPNYTPIIPLGKIVDIAA